MAVAAKDGDKIPTQSKLTWKEGEKGAQRVTMRGLFVGASHTQAFSLMTPLSCTLRGQGVALSGRPPSQDERKRKGAAEFNEEVRRVISDSYYHRGTKGRELLLKAVWVQGGPVVLKPFFDRVGLSIGVPPAYHCKHFDRWHQRV